MYDDVYAEAMHDYEDEREPRERPSEYEEERLDLSGPPSAGSSQWSLGDLQRQWGIDPDDGFGYRCPQCGTDDHDSMDHPL